MNPEERLQKLCSESGLQMPKNLFQMLSDAKNSNEFIAELRKIGLDFDFLSALFMQVSYIALTKINGAEPNWQENFSVRFDVSAIDDDGLRFNAMLREVRQYVLGDNINT